MTEANTFRTTWLRPKRIIVIVLALAVLGIALGHKVIRREIDLQRMLHTSNARIANMAYEDLVGLGRPPKWQMKRIIARLAPGDGTYRPAREHWSRLFVQFGFNQQEQDELMLAVLEAQK